MKKIVVWFVKLFSTVVVVLMAFAFTLAMVGRMFQSEETRITHQNTVAVVEVTSEIRDTSEVLDRLYELADNKDIQGIVVRVDSPGGAVGPSQELYTAIKKIKDKKPVVVSMGSIAASGGLYLSLAANKIFCQPGTLTGSIGVIMQSPNFSSIADKVGFTMTTVKSGKLKDVGNPFRPVSAEDQAFLQGVVMNIYSQFVDAVVEGRSIPREEVLKFADGRIIPGSVAKELKLVDEFGDVHDAARAVFALKNRPLAEGEQPHLIYPGKKFSKLKELFGVVEQIGERLSTSSKVKFLVDF